MVYPTALCVIEDNWCRPDSQQAGQIFDIDASKKRDAEGETEGAKLQRIPIRTLFSSLTSALS